MQTGAHWQTKWPPTMNELDDMKRVFDAHRAEWIEQGRTGQWALIGPDGPVDFFVEYVEIVKAAARLFGNGPCLIQQVLPEDPIEIIQRVDFSAFA